MTDTTIEYIGERRAARLTDDQAALLCSILNRYSDAGPTATDTSIQFFALPHTLECINQARPNLNELGNALADSIVTSLNATPTGVEAMLISETHALNPDGSETHTATFQAPEFTPFPTRHPLE